MAPGLKEAWRINATTTHSRKFEVNRLLIRRRLPRRLAACEHCRRRVGMRRRMNVRHGAGKKLRASAGDPISGKTNPFAHGRIDASQSITGGREWPQCIFQSACAPIDRIGFYRKADLSEDAHRPRQMISGGYKQPALSRHRLS